MKIRNYRYFLISICLTTSLMLIKKYNILESVKDSIIPRSLFEEKVKNYACDKAGSRLTDKYSNGFTEKDPKSKSLSKAQRSIVDFAKDSSYSNIKPYIKKLGIFIFFLVLDIILIFVWISYCSCCCCSCCLFSSAKPSKICRTIFFLIAAICKLLVIIFSIVVLGLINPFFKRVNGFVCSAFNFIDHVRYGLAPSYPNNQKEWGGIDGIINLLNYTEIEKDNIEETLDTISSNISPYKSGQCKEFLELDSFTNSIKDLVNESFSNMEFGDEINDLKDAKKTFDDADEDIGDDAYDVLHNYINKLAKKICTLIFTLTLIFGILGLAFLCLYYILKYNAFRIVYVVIWNISMLLMLFAILFAVVFGVLGYVLRDAVQVGQYILSPENLNSDDPLLFDSNKNNNDYGYDDDEKDISVSDLIDECANKDGNFMDILQENGQLRENIENWEKNQSIYRDKINNIDDPSCTESEKEVLRDNYEKLIDVTSVGLNISNNLTSLKCRFARNDKNIILNEVDSAGKKGVALCGCSLLVGILLGISVVAGIIFVHKYKYDDSSNDDKKDLNNITGVNESSENIGKDNTKNNNNSYSTNNLNNNINIPKNDMNYPYNNTNYPNNMVTNNNMNL